MTVKELYDRMSERIPHELSEPWDNDGLMCSPDVTAEVAKVLVTLDVTEQVVDYAVEGGFDLIVAHHPLIFKPLAQVNNDNNVARKVIKLIQSGISVFSFHTRADKVKDGVNDQLCDALDLHDAVPFGDGCLGRIGYTDEEMTLEDFAYRLKDQLEVSAILSADAYNPVHRVAVVGGSGKDYVRAAIEAGADTFVSGRLDYHIMEDAEEIGINLIEAGQYFTEYPVTGFFCTALTHIDPSLYIETVGSNNIKLL